MRKGKFWLVYLLLAAAQMLLCNYVHLSAYLFISILPVMVLCISTRVPTWVTMVIAFLTGLAVDILSEGLRDLGYEVFGGKNSPYIWCRVPQGYTSWSFFDHLLNDCQVVCTPGSGFGPSGEGYVRFSAFSNREDCEEALSRMKKAKIINHQSSIINLK